MTKEELEKEAEEYAYKNKIYIDFDNDITDYGNVKEAYLAGAEPREKRITELEKENAELKAQLENDRDLPAIAYMQGAEKQKKKYEGQLTKAKEIIQKLITNAPDTYSGTNIELQQRKMFSFQDAVNKAEQFLKEEANENYKG